MGGKPEEMRGNALQLGHNDPDHTGTLGNLNPQHFFNREHITEVVAHAGEIIHAVCVVDKILVALVLTGFFKTTVQITQIWVNIHHIFAIQLDHQAQNAVGARMVWPHIDDHVFTIHPWWQGGGNTFGWQDLLAQGGKFGIAPGQREGYLFATQWNVLAQRVVGPMFRHENPPQIRVPFELDAH